MKEDEAHATMVKEAVERLNKCVMDACRTGLDVRLDIKPYSTLAYRDIPVLNYHVSRTVKRG